MRGNARALPYRGPPAPAAHQSDDEPLGPSSPSAMGPGDMSTYQPPPLLEPRRACPQPRCAVALQAAWRRSPQQVAGAGSGARDITAGPGRPRALVNQGAGRGRGGGTAGARTGAGAESVFAGLWRGCTARRRDAVLRDTRSRWAAVPQG